MKPPFCILVLSTPDRFIRKGAILLITAYRRLVGPWLSPVCRFDPSCSEYGLQAFRKYSAPKALVLTLGRIFRCHPFCRGGVDPLP